MKKKIVIIGGCAAGPKVAAKSRRMDPETDIELYTQEDIISYSACGLPYFVGGYIKDPNKLIVRTPQNFEDMGVKVHTGHRCTKIIPAENTVIINDKPVQYDELVLATGATPFIPNIKNIHLKNIFHLRTVNDAIAMKEAIHTAKSALIVGAGYIAVELLEAFVKNKLNVTMMERGAHIVGIFDDEMSDEIEKCILDNSPKVNIVKNDEVLEFLGTDKFEGVLTKGGKEIRADLCVLAMGVIPNAELAREAGIEIGPTRAIKVDSHLRTSIPNIWAAGDCAEKYSMITQEPVYVALGSIANKEGRVLAINLNGGCEDFEGVLGSSVTKYFGYTIATTGLSEKAAKKSPNLDPVSCVLSDVDKAGYMPDKKCITIKLVADRISRRILGAQAIGKGDADKRVNATTAAIQSKMRIDEFLSLDLTYAPPYSTAVDPLLAVAIKVKEKMDD